MLGTPGHPIITEAWQLVLLIAAGIGGVAALHHFILRRVARDKARDHDD